MGLIIYMCIFILLAFLLYAIVPTIYIRLTGSQIIKTCGDTNQIALTFDDGPNPDYTMRLLNLLEKYHVKATFFVVGRKLRNHRENRKIIEKMAADGHTIGIHNYNHTSNWFLSPFALKKQIAETAQVIKEITHKEVMFYRPPWGHFNLWTLSLCKSYHVAMWSHIYNDWKVKRSQTTLLKDLRQTSTSGSIILLHDCGETLGADKSAPHYMLNALEIYLQESIKKGIQFMSLQDVINRVDNKYEH